MIFIYVFYEIFQSNALNKQTALKIFHNINKSYLQKLELILLLFNYAADNKIIKSIISLMASSSTSMLLVMDHMPGPGSLNIRGADPIWDRPYYTDLIMHKIWIRKNGKTPFIKWCLLGTNETIQIRGKNGHKCIARNWR